MQIHEDNIFSYNCKTTNIDNIFKVLFGIIITTDLTVNNKFKFLKDSLENFLIKQTNKQNEFIDYFCKIQKTYNTLNKFIYSYKYKKSNIVVNTDMCLNELNVNDKNTICIFNNNSKYLFHINDLIKIINTSLTNSYLFFSEPKCIKNPYDNLPFNKSTLYNIYFHIRYKTNYYPELFVKFFQCNFNLTLFKNKNEYILREYAINNYVYKSPSNILLKEIHNMIKYFNQYCKDCFLKCKIQIDKDFPSQKLIKIMQPYLLLFFISQYAFLRRVRNETMEFFKRCMLRFYYFNPSFGRKKYKILIKTSSDLKKRVCGKIIEFDDKHIKFNNIEKQTNNFLKDHLTYEDTPLFYDTTILRTTVYFNLITNQNYLHEENTNIDLSENNDETYVVIDNENNSEWGENINEDTDDEDNAIYEEEYESDNGTEEAEDDDSIS
jgi:hypothetical protein